MKDKNKVFKYKLVGGMYSNPQYFNSLGALANRIDTTKGAIKKAIMEDGGKIRDFTITLNEDFCFNDFIKGEQFELDGVMLTVINANYENIVVVKDSSRGTGVLDIRTMQLVSGLQFENEERKRRRQNTNNFSGG